MARKKPTASRMSELLSTSEDRLERASQEFHAARTTLANAETFGTEAHAKAADQALVEAARSYASAMRTHAMVVVDYAAERTA